MKIHRWPAVFALALLTCSLSAQEICNNAIDDDFDGLVDLSDTTDCDCLNGLNLGSGSLIPNPSFEDFNCLPTSWSQLNCADTWQQATIATSDYFNSLSYYPAIFPQPVPDGTGLAGGYAFPGWQEYLGACLTSPMLAGETYTITFDIAATGADGFFSSVAPIWFGPIDITIFGAPTCTPFPLPITGCPVGTSGYVELGASPYTPSFTWSTITITFVPTVDIYAIILGSPCILPLDYVTNFSGHSPYIFYDDLTLNESLPFLAVVDSVGGFCTNDRGLIAHPDTASGIYQWYYENSALIGETDTILDISANGYLPGTYQFFFEVNDTICSVTQVEVMPPAYPDVQFSVSMPAGCTPLTTDLTNTTAAWLTGTCFWDFGDGTTSSICAATHTFTLPGTYDVTLTVTSPQSCVGDTMIIAAVEVFPLPLASFAPDTLGGCIDLPVNFTNTTALGTYASSSWAFGDGGISLLNDPFHLYTVAGVYDVTLTVTSADGCVDDTTMVALIDAEDSPVVLLSADVYDGCSPLSVQFSNDTDPAMTASCFWDLGNGITSTDCDPQNVYPATGTYTVSLTVTSSWGCTGDTTVSPMITVYGHPYPDFSNVPDSGCYPLEVMFANLTDPAMTASCAWTFGDGGTSTDCDPTYIYADPGVYDVSLTITSPEGCLGDTIFPQLITVFDHPTADFTFYPQPTDVFQTTVLFFDASSEDVVDWDWAFGQFGSLGSATGPSPGFIFPDMNPGEYPVTLIVTNIHGCTDTIAYTVVIDPYFSVFVPNSFTPDGDGVNDNFFPVLMDHDPKQFELTIFDRWGGKVFESTTYEKAWTGGYMNGGDPLPTGVYVWRLVTASIVNHNRKEYIGHVSLLK